MKKLSLFLSILLITGCNNQVNLDTFDNTTSIQNIEKFNSVTAKNKYNTALKEAKKYLSKPVLFEIDVWKETDSENIHFGFMQKNTDNSHDFVRIIVSMKDGKVSHEEIDNGGKIPQPVDVKNWKIDHTQILKTAQDNGLKDETFLATLWEDTWHISGLKQHLYFQINSSTGQIKMICVGPYMNDCTDANLNPITPRTSNNFQKKLGKIK